MRRTGIIKPSYRLLWKGKGEILQKSIADRLQPDELSYIAPYAVVPDDLWDFLRKEFRSHGPGLVRIMLDDFDIMTQGKL